MSPIPRREFLRASAVGSIALGLFGLTGTNIETTSSRADANLIPQDNREAAVPTIIHRLASIPMLLDGTLLKSQEAIMAYNGVPLYYTPLHDGSRLVLAAFTSREAMLKAHAKAENICVSNPDNLPARVSFYEHMNEDGDVLGLNPGRAYRNLTRVRRSLFTDWNDVISSVSWCCWDVSLYEHIDYGGSELFLPAGCNTTYLEGLGWNDRASSLANWGRRF